MIQDIQPHIFNNNYSNKTPKENDRLLCFDGSTALIDPDGGEGMFPRFSEIERNCPQIYDQSVYLFEVDGTNFFLLLDTVPAVTGAYRWTEVETFRTLQPEWMAFCAVTGGHLYRWYRDHIYCGRCGKRMSRKEDERAMVCGACGRLEFPTLCPAVIVAVCDGDRLLMTRYAHRTYRHYALVAGFAEIGETLEETAQREVLEEVGLRVKNLRYYKNQPWGFSQSLLVGFFAELDGSDEITLEEAELAEATWVKRQDIEPPASDISLTSEMIEAFRSGQPF